MIHRFVNQDYLHPKIQSHLVGAYFFFFFYTAALHTPANTLPLYEPVIVPPTSLDFLIPLMPWTVIPYLTYFLLVPSMLYFYRKEVIVSGMYLSVILCTSFHLLFVNLVPSRLEYFDWGRANFWLTQFLEKADTPLAVLPSGHVALPTTIIWLAFANKLKGRYAYLVWGTLVSLSTLTTKQHYLHDLMGGILVGVIAGWAGHHIFVRRARELKELQ
jgi:membrane-associated phospholipid phosphatase